MKFSTTILIGSVAALASAAATTTAVALTPQESCVVACKPGDVNCQADCVGTPHPNDQGVNETTQCSANCDQGDGSAADTEKYAQCLKKCSDEFYATTGGAGPSPATVPAGITTSGAAAVGSTLATLSSAAPLASGSSGSSNGSHHSGNSGSNAKSSAGSGSSASGTAGSSASGTASSSAANASSSGGAAPYVKVGTSAAGIVGLVMALFAL